MNSLIPRLERATGPDRELDQDIGLAVGLPATTVIGDGLITEQRHIPHNAPHYTASLDAALTLVPEGWEGQVNVNGEGGCWLDPPSGLPSTHRIHGEGRVYAHAETNPLALCIAALKAREENA